MARLNDTSALAPRPLRGPFAEVAPVVLGPDSAERHSPRRGVGLGRNAGPDKAGGTLEEAVKDLRCDK